MREENDEEGANQSNHGEEDSPKSDGPILHEMPVDDELVHSWKLLQMAELKAKVESDCPNEEIVIDDFLFVILMAANVGL